jgi:hypothetical protein
MAFFMLSPGKLSRIILALFATASAKTPIFAASQSIGRRWPLAGYLLTRS